MFDESENTVDTTATETIVSHEDNYSGRQQYQQQRERETSRKNVTWGGVITVALIFSLLFGMGGGLAGYFLGRANGGGSSVVINQPTPTVKVNDKEVYSAVVDTVNKVSPAVVSITVNEKVPVRSSNPFDNFFGGSPFDNFFGDPNQQQPPSGHNNPNHQEYQIQQSAGSGVIIKNTWTEGQTLVNVSEKNENNSGAPAPMPKFEGSLVLTNNHVVAAQNAEIFVVLNDKRKFLATVVATDPIADLAILKVAEKNLPTAELGDSKALKVGEPVIAIGNPYQFSNTVTTGVISALERNLPGEQSTTGQGTSPTMVGIIQTDAAINPGNSGGPLVTLDGKIVGINTMIYSKGQNLGFAVSSNTAKRVVGELLKYGKVLWPYLGISGTDMTSEIAKQMGISNIEGAFVARVNSGPAREAGIFANDIITSIDNVKVTSFEQLLMEVRAKHVGDVVILSVNRGGKELKIKVKLADLPVSVNQQ